jgi:RecA-family ATPase
MSPFRDLALPLAERGIPVIPVLPNQKRCVLPEWQTKATTDRDQILRWDAENASYNVGCVGKPQGVVILDCDVVGLKKRIEQETEHTFPPTLIVKSGGKGAAHIYMLQNEWSRKLGNRSAIGLFDLQSIDKYVVGPGSTLGAGQVYRIIDASTLAEFPEWLYEWIAKHSTPEKSKKHGEHPTDEDFDFDKFCEHYDISGHQDGDYFVTDICPVAGRKHQHSEKTGFFWDGTSLGWHCFATQFCEGSNMKIGEVIRFLNKTHEPYREVIWPQETLEQTLAAFDIEAADTSPEAEPISADQPAERSETGEIELGSLHIEESGQSFTYSLIAQRASDVREELINWLWQDKIVLGEGNLFVGEGGSGKTSTAIEVIKRTTTGEDWPDGSKNALGPREVLIMSVEDSVEKVLRPKLRAAGADLNMAWFVKRVKGVSSGEDTLNRKIQLKSDVALLKRTLRAHPDIKLIFVDPLSSFLGKADLNKDEDVRPILEELQTMLKSTDVALIGIMHTNKRPDANAMGKIKGAGAFGEVFRQAWSFQKDPDKRGERSMNHIKGNYTENEKGMTFRLASVDIEICGEKRPMSVVEWLGETEETGDDALARSRNKNREQKDSDKMISAKLFLKAQLEHGERKSSGEDGLIEIAKAEGINKTTLWRAKEALGLAWVRRGGEYYWSLNRGEEQIPPETGQVM